MHRSFIWYKNVDRSSFRFVTIHAFDRQTDRWTDGRTLIARPRLHSCSAVKMSMLIQTAMLTPNLTLTICLALHLSYPNINPNIISADRSPRYFSIFYTFDIHICTLANYRQSMMGLQCRPSELAWQRKGCDLGHGARTYRYIQAS